MKEITTESFDREVLASKKSIIILDAYAEFCTPCKGVLPVLERIATKYPDDVEVFKLNIEEQPDLAKQFRIVSLPTILIFHWERIVERFCGVSPKLEQQIEEKIEFLLIEKK